jgi:hypothetical protein
MCNDPLDENVSAADACVIRAIPHVGPEIHGWARCTALVGERPERERSLSDPRATATGSRRDSQPARLAAVVEGHDTPAPLGAVRRHAAPDSLPICSRRRVPRLRALPGGPSHRCFHPQDELGLVKSAAHHEAGRPEAPVCESASLMNLLLALVYPSRSSRKRTASARFSAA